MVAMAFDNVIRFPDGARSPGAGPDRVRTLKDAKDLLAQKFREALRSMLTSIGEDLMAKGDVADERDQRSHYYGAREALNQNSVRLEALLAAQWLRLFDEAIRGGVAKPTPAKTENLLDNLQLVDFGEMDEDLATKAIASRLRDGCEEGLFAAGRRLAFLAGRDDDSLLVDEMLVQALRVALTEIGFSAAVRLEVLRGAESRAVDVFGPPIHDLNAFLVGRNVLPKLRRSYSRATPGKPEAGEPSQGGAGARDVFSLLQRLVGSGGPAVPAAPGIAGGAPGAAPGMSMGSGMGMADGIASVASMAEAMEKVMASLDVLQRAVPTVVEVTPTTNVLREFRTSGAGQSLGHLDAVTVDIVATLFDFIFDDRAIADPIKALIGRLQIPVLKVAMLDKSFFSSKAHPARRLLDGISRAAVRCGPAAGHEDPLYARIAEIIERLQNEFAQDTSLFDSLCTELEDFLDSQELAADACAARAAPLVAAQEHREMAAVAAEQALAGWLQMPLPAAVTDLMDNEWRALLVRHYVAGDDEAWGAAISTMADLVASVQPQPDVKDRKLLAARLPVLVKRIHDGLDCLDIPDNRRLSLIDSLFSLHAAVLRGAAPVVTTSVPETPTAAAEPEIASERIDEGDAQLESISLVAADLLPVAEAGGDIPTQVADLQRGDWVEFSGGESGPVRYRLAWVSPQRGILLFTNPQSPRALSVAPAALALQIERGEAAIVPVEPIFDRAVTRALEALQAA
jgi:hypothetical protein